LPQAISLFATGNFITASQRFESLPQAISLLPASDLTISNL
jgi:hypothetical protein